MEVLQDIDYSGEKPLLGKRKLQTSVFSADSQYLDKVGRNTFYGFLATHSHRIFGDEDYSELYCRDNGRESVPPSLLAVALLLQSYDRVSDQEVVSRATFRQSLERCLGYRTVRKAFCQEYVSAFSF